MRYLKSIPLTLIVCLFLFSIPHAQQLRIAVDGGLSKIVGPNHNDFNWGFAVGGHLFFYVDNNILLGIRGAYNRWTPSESNLSDNVNNLLNGKVSGNAWSVEIIPTIRLTTDYPMSIVNFFAQFGAGVYILNNQFTVQGTSAIDAAPIEEIFGDGTRGRFGLQGGLGFSFGSPQLLSLDVFSLYNLVFTGNTSSLKYFTINIGLSLGI